MKQTRRVKYIVLVGFMGSGKTTMGRAVARERRIPFFDLDTLFKKKTRLTPGAYFAKHGEKAFRSVESKLFRALLKQWESKAGQKNAKGAILATGGGVVLLPANRQALQRAVKRSSVRVLWLNPSWKTLWSRLCKERKKAGARASRPLLWNAAAECWRTQKEVRVLWSKRRRLYRLCSRIR